MTYDIFRQGLEIQDLNPITYQIIAKNKKFDWALVSRIDRSRKNAGLFQDSKHNDYPGSITTIAINKT